MDLINLILHNIFAFIVIISAIVFIHEFGHFFVARLCGVKVEEFSIGFGKELFGFNDKKGTRWKICAIPMGGYVKMFGDKNPASVTDHDKIKKLTKKEKAQSFYFKNVYQRIAIVSAGPIANFILAIFILTFLFKINGLNTVAPIVDEVLKDSAAFAAGLQKNDKIILANNEEINDFNDLRQIIAMSNGEKIDLKILRNEKILEVVLTPKIQKTKDVFGNEVETPLIGITASQINNTKLNFSQSFIAANKETYNISISILKALKQLITGQRSIEELGGPIKIAKYSGQSFEMGIVTALWFAAMISINLGVINLIPLPILDGGHLFYYFFEIILRKPLPQKVQQIGFQLGFGIVIALMIFTTLNDVKQIIIEPFLK